MKKTFAERCRAGWHYFTAYEKIWFFSILVLAVLFSFLFPETDDPTYTVTLSPDACAGACMLDFRTTEDAFVITSLSVGNESFSAHELYGVEEYTVFPEKADTLLLSLPRTPEPNETLSFECYPDGDKNTVSLLLPTGTYTVTLSEDGAGTAGCTVKEHPPRYLISPFAVMLLYLLDTVTNIACELLISKQSKWNFLVSLLVELTEIAICIVCIYRFATLAVTLFFWIPCDIVSFVTWHRHSDKENDELTVVKTLSPMQDILVVAGILVWTAVIGYLLTFIEVEGGVFSQNILLKNVACYLDACVSAVGIVNGLFILFRYREQWLAWYISALLETIINIMAGQYMLLILKVGYLTNTTYGYIRWTKYIRRKEADSVPFQNRRKENRKAAAPR